MFIDRQKELDFFNHILTRRRPGPAQMVLLYGRRRVGKPTPTYYPYRHDAFA